MRSTTGLLAFALVACTGCATTGASAPARLILPLTTLRLYETGVGYFERSGTLTPGERTALPVPASHLDDALKSLVVLTSDKADPLRGIEFTSSLSRGMARATAGLPTDADTPITYRDLLASLKGAHVEVKTPKAALVGRLIDVDATEEPAPVVVPAAGGEPKDEVPKPPKTSPFRLVILTDGGELLRVASPDIVSVRATESAYAARLDAALDALSMHSAQSRKMLDLFGASRGPITLAYVSETPVWRTTYRLVLGGAPGDAKHGMLQGWALLHNDTDEDWQSVKVELANGRPDSFLFPLAAPRYTRRALVHPDDELSTVPQLRDRTVDAIWGDNVGDSFGAGGLALTGVGEGGGGRGEGVGYGGTLGHGSAVGSSYGMALADVARIDQATGVEAGALFVYTLPDRLALRAHASALVPFLRQETDAEPIAWIDAVGSPARSAVRFVNSTTRTLPNGTISFFSDGGFAGEANLDRLKPGERRFVRFGADLDIEVKRARGADSAAGPDKLPLDVTQRLTYSPGTLSEHVQRTCETTYSFENRSGHPRAVYLRLGIEPDARVTGADEVDFDAVGGAPIAVVRVGAKTKVVRTIVTVETLTRGVSLDRLTAEELGKLAASAELRAPDKAIAAEAGARQKKLEETRQAMKRASAELAAVEKELTRLREDAKAVGGEHGAPPAEFAKRLLAAEDRHTALRKQLDGFSADEKARAESVGAVLARLAG